MTDVDALPHGTPPAGVESIMIKQGGVWVEITLMEFFQRVAQASGIGGFFDLVGGDGASGLSGGYFSFRGGNGAGGSPGGYGSITGGEGGPDGGPGGDGSVTGGKGGPGAHGGSILLTGGAGGDGDGRGGDVYIEAGDGPGGRGVVYAYNLPTSDPLDEGALWSESGFMRVSQG